MNPKELVIRRAVANDIDLLSALFVELDEHHIHLRPDVFKRLNGPARDLETLKRLIESTEQQAIFVAESPSGVLIGFVHLLERHAPESIVALESRSAEIDALVVSPPYRRTAVATALIGRAEQWAKERCLSKLTLSVRAFNSEAVTAYEAMGFEYVVHKMARSIAD